MKNAQHHLLLGKQIEKTISRMATRMAKWQKLAILGIVLTGSGENGSLLHALLQLIILVYMLSVVLVFSNVGLWLCIVSVQCLCFLS